ncbi:hypothetical protein B566_EDAN010160 [Ephemera danica]|nr:hypothetical protein B566_EDAN010160 [Ephemera danica]
MKKAIAALAIFLLVPVDPKDIAVIDGRLYYFSSIAVTVSEAITVCRELNMTLAGLETQQEFDAVNNYITSNLATTAHFLTSGTLQLNMWVWSNVGKPFSYFNWATLEPDGRDDELSLCVGEGSMWDCFVTSSWRFVCEETTSC